MVKDRHSACPLAETSGAGCRRAALSSSDRARGANSGPRIAGVVGKGLIILLVFGGGCAVLVGVVFKSAGDAVDPANNAKTGLVDGSYLLTTNGSYASVNDSCALGSDTSLVAFVVSGGQAAIVEVK